MFVQAGELAVGATIAFLTLRDVFETVVVPSGPSGGLRLTKRLVRLLLPLRTLIRRRAGIPTRFAPSILVFSFLGWMALLALAFGLMAHALRGSFTPPLPDFAQAVYVAGSGLATLGLSDTHAFGPARWLVLGSGLCGLAVMTMAVTYLLEVQSSIAGRDSGILKLQTAAGNPPSAVALLEKFAAIGNIADLGEALRDGRDWCAKVHQSHAAHPSLIYFRSAGTGAGWPAALSALLDLALIIELVVDLPAQKGRAVLLREDGTRMAQTLCEIVGVEQQSPGECDLAGLRERLARAGFALVPDDEGAAFLNARADLLGLAAGLSEHLGQPSSA